MTPADDALAAFVLVQVAARKDVVLIADIKGEDYDAVDTLAELAAVEAVVGHWRWACDLYETSRICLYETVAAHIRTAVLALAQPYRGRDGWRDEWEVT